MSAWIQAASDFLWGLPMLIMVLGTGLYLLVRLRAVQLRQFWPALRSVAQRATKGATRAARLRNGAPA